MFQNGKKKPTTTAAAVYTVIWLLWSLRQFMQGPLYFTCHVEGAQ